LGGTEAEGHQGSRWEKSRGKGDIGGSIGLAAYWVLSPRKIRRKIPLQEANSKSPGERRSEKEFPIGETFKTNNCPRIPGHGKVARPKNRGTASTAGGKT